MIPIIMSDEGWEDVEEGTEALLQEWQVQAGDTLSAGQTVAIAELVKTTHEIVSPCAGTISDLLVPAGDTFPKGAILARLAKESA